MNENSSLRVGAEANNLATTCTERTAKSTAQGMVKDKLHSGQLAWTELAIIQCSGNILIGLIRV